MRSGSATPIYQQVVDQVRLAVAVGDLATGDPLPSVRTLAEQLVVNPNTVARAFGELVREGVVESRHGQGVFVAAKRRIFTDDERDRRMNLALVGLLSEAAALDFSAARSASRCGPTIKRSGLAQTLKVISRNALVSGSVGATPTEPDASAFRLIKPDNVKRQVIRRREFKHLEMKSEQVAELEYQPLACQRPYRMVVIRKNISHETGENVLFDEIRDFF